MHLVKIICKAGGKKEKECQKVMLKEFNQLHIYQYFYAFTNEFETSSDTLGHLISVKNVYLIGMPLDCPNSPS